MSIHFLVGGTRLGLGVGGVGAAAGWFGTAPDRGDTVTDSIMLTSESVCTFMICTKHVLYQVKQGLKTLLFSGY